MSPQSNPYIVDQLKHLIYYHLDNHHLQNAAFMAGRLHAYDLRSGDAAHLLALCQFRLGQYQLAYESSKSLGLKGGHLGCAYVFAQTCLALANGKEKEGITALEKARDLWGGRSTWNQHSETSRRHLPDAASVYCLMGKLWYGNKMVDSAVDYYVEALKLNPFMWDAFIGLCDSGANMRTTNIFKITPEMSAMLSSSSDPSVVPEITEAFTVQHQPQHQPPPPPSGPRQSQNHNHHQVSSNVDPFSGRSSNRLAEGRRTRMTSIRAPNFNSDSNFDALDTPTGPGAIFDTDSTMGGGGGGVEGGGDLSETLAVSTSLASLRGHHGRNRPTPAVVVEERHHDPPIMLRPTSTRPRGRIGGGDEVETVAQTINITRASSTTTTTTSSSSAHLVAADRKRTISGQIAGPVIDPTTTTTTAAAAAAAPQRRSVRLYNQIRPASSKLASGVVGLGFRDGRDHKKAKATGTKGRTAAHSSSSSSTVGRVVSGNRKATEPMIDVDVKPSQPAPHPPPPPPPPPVSHTITVMATRPSTMTVTATTIALRREEALEWLLHQFRFLGGGYYSLSHYRCHDAMSMFGAISTGQRESPWVLAQIGRVYYEQAAYAEAERYFRRLRAMTPSRLDDMEIYSTVLWHQKKEVDLAFLAHELMDIDRLTPQAWCAVGNTFSLQRDHDQALKCFKRATQVDPHFAYAFTLQGHEHVSNEEYDKALTAYRAAVHVDNRHYNAWYGLGNVFEKMGQYDMAQSHFCIAIRINPTNPVLICCLGAALEKNKKPRTALVQYEEAIRLAPKTALPRYRKARVLFELGEHQMALEELKICKDIAPDEANVHFWLGKVYKTLRQRGDAIKHFTIALNLDPKAGQCIKMTIESMEDEDDIDIDLGG